MISFHSFNRCLSTGDDPRQEDQQAGPGQRPGFGSILPNGIGVPYRISACNQSIMMHVDRDVFASPTLVFLYEDCTYCDRRRHLGSVGPNHPDHVCTYIVLCSLS